MADIYLHVRMAEAITQKMDYPFVKPLIYMGAQGPDPLYYLQFDKEAKEYRYYADRMHDTNTQMLLTNIVQYVRRHLNEETYSFLVGFICHYALDVKLHPYVYYNVGVYEKDKPETHQYKGLHLKFERSIDAVVIERDEKLKAHKFNFQKKYFPKYKVPEVVSSIMGYALKQTYGKDDGEEMYHKAARAMQFNLRHFVRDRFGIKKQIYKLIDAFNKDTDLFYQDLSFYKHIEAYDYLNEKKTEWAHPVTNEKFTYTVDELYDQAIQFAKEILLDVNKYVIQKKDVDLSKVFTNLSFNSGVACDHENPMRHFKNYRIKDN